MFDMSLTSAAVRQLAGSPALRHGTVAQLALEDMWQAPFQVWLSHSQNSAAISGSTYLDASSDCEIQSTYSPSGSVGRGASSGHEYNDIYSRLDEFVEA